MKPEMEKKWMVSFSGSYCHAKIPCLKTKSRLSERKAAHLFGDDPIALKKLLICH